MKKSILLFTVFSIFIFSCSEDENLNKNFINPPNWILGTWMDNSSRGSGGFQFTIDNLILITSDGSIFLNLKEGLQKAIDVGSMSTNEVITNSIYELEIISNGNVNLSYKFIRGSDDKNIIHKSSASDNIILTKQ